MHISKLNLVNYRNFQNATVCFKKGINTIIGENGSGKSNLFRAIRLLLDENMVKASFHLNEDDFNRGIGSWKGHWIIISLEFEDISHDEAIQALFLHGSAVIGAPIGKATYNLIFRPRKEIRQKLSALPAGDSAGLADILSKLTVSDYETIFTGRSTMDFSNRAEYNAVVGDFENVIFPKETEFAALGCKTPSYLSLNREVCFTYIQALRDVVSEFHNNRTNPLFSLLKSKSGDVAPAALAPIVKMVGDLNSSIEQLDDVKLIRSDVYKTIKETAGETYSPSRLSIRSDLSSEAEELFQSLRLFVGEGNDGHEGTINELSLGGANLIYLTLKLLAFKYQKEKKVLANFLIIEEPEAHIHTHIQKTLFDRMQYSETQVVYSTHSTHISEVSAIENVNIIGREEKQSKVYQPATGLTAPEIGNIQRYLDAIRSNLLFARSVMLVEGDAEELLIPVLVKKVFGVSLDELGISLINIRSTGFQNVALLFHDNRIRKQCAIVTDLDSSIVDTTPIGTDTEASKKYKEKCAASEKSGQERKVILDAFAAGNSWVDVYYATHTFEVDFVECGNAELISGLVDSVYVDPATRALAKAELLSGDKALFGKRILTMAAQEGKGWFAIKVGGHVNWKTRIPNYLIRALVCTHRRFSAEIIANMMKYRLALFAAEKPGHPDILSLNLRVEKYRNDWIDFSGLREQYKATFTEDIFNDFLAVFP
jgi:putative ATP-dependent endonuclease of the OLD family